MSEQTEYSEYAINLINQGQKFFCQHCKTQLNGERNCPNCHTKIFYPGEFDNNNLSKLGNGLQNAGGKIEKAGNSLSKTRNSLILGCTIPIFY
ncbi:MAG TPA: hypothetical protein K8V00_02860 [Ligilactobacillus acidipiscis]|uniref:DUF3279 domain-containing protein n=1 Tax=Ligilactobacillus acidipiscis TaxID=89059 RepID=A0A921F9B5_9LACO|nr:hypothetical protein [Ligilactobacillus acidipiscis]